MAWAPVIGLTLIAVLQNVDVIVAKHHFDGDGAGAYAAAGVAAKAVVWVAIGVGFYLVPEATRRAAAGQQPRTVLLRTLVVVVALAVPALAIFAIAPDLLLKLAFGPKYTQAADALVVLGLAMTFLAVTYLAVQYLLALGHFRFLARPGRRGGRRRPPADRQRRRHARAASPPSCSPRRRSASPRRW